MARAQFDELRTLAHADWLTGRLESAKGDPRVTRDIYAEIRNELGLIGRKGGGGAHDWTILTDPTTCELVCGADDAALVLAREISKSIADDIESTSFSRTATEARRSRFEYLKDIQLPRECAEGEAQGLGTLAAQHNARS